MRIFYGLLIVIVSVILWLLPVSQAVYDYRTDIYSDYYNYETGGAVTTANVVLSNPIYNNDTNTITIMSDLYTDNPLFASYCSTNRLLDMTGMTAAANRTITVHYDISALVGLPAVATLMDWMPYIWWILISIFPMAGLFFIVRSRRM